MCSIEKKQMNEIKIGCSKETLPYSSKWMAFYWEFNGEVIVRLDEIKNGLMIVDFGWYDGKM